MLIEGQMDNLPFVCYCACIVGVALFAAAALSLFSSVGYRLSGRHGVTFCGINFAALSPFRAHRFLSFSHRQVGLPLFRSSFSTHQNRDLNCRSRFLVEPWSVWPVAPCALPSSAFFWLWKCLSVPAVSVCGPSTLGRQG